MGWPSGPSTAAVALRFLGFGGPVASDATGEGTVVASSASSAAFRLWLSLAEGTLGEARGAKEGPGLASVPFGKLAVTRARGYWHGRRLAPHVASELSGLLPVSQQWSVLHAQGLVK
jgi:hypothetical protein